MTIPYAGVCVGSGGPPLDGSVQDAGDESTGLCPACSGRFALRDGSLTEHETAPEDEREQR